MGKEEKWPSICRSFNQFGVRNVTVSKRCNPNPPFGQLKVVFLLAFFSRGGIVETDHQPRTSQEGGRLVFTNWGQETGY